MHGRAVLALVGRKLNDSAGHRRKINWKIVSAARSKKFANHCHGLAIYFAFYNFVKVHSSLRMSPAMAAGIETRLSEMAFGDL